MKYENVFSLLEKITILNNEKISLGMKSKWGWNEFTYKGLGLLSRRLACHLINDLQIPRGEKLAILSESKPEYGACVFGAVLAGLTTVPLDNKLTIYELESILSNCEPTVLLVSGANIDKAKELQTKVPAIKHIILMESSSAENSNIQSLYSIPENYEAKWRRRPLNATAFLIYTSGTTGNPKGVEITFKNMLSQMYDLQIALKEILPSGDMRMLSILPMNHLFELTVGFFTFLNHGFSIYYTQSLKPKDILDVMTEKKIKFMITVPAFLKLLKTSIESEINKKSAITQILFKFSFEIARFLPMKYRKILFKQIHNKFGGEFYGCISGGAPLDSTVGEFFNRIGIRIYQGYGLSETSPVVAVNRGKIQDIKSVGPALRSFEAKTDTQTGELLLRGPSVMKGYYKRDDLTLEVIDNDGWLHTGDIAHIDSKTKLIYITGRIKNMIVLSGGKKVFPEEIESVLEQSPNFAEVCVMGLKRNFGEKDGCEEIAAVIVPSENYCQQFKNNRKELEAAIKNEVKYLSNRLAPYKRPINIIVRQENLPRTTTRKLKRTEIKKILCECSK